MSPYEYSFTAICACIPHTSDFCDKSKELIRGDKLACDSASGDDGVRTGLVVGCLVSSVVVLLAWVILVLLWWCGPICENNKCVTHFTCTCT